MISVMKRTFWILIGVGYFFSIFTNLSKYINLAIICLGIGMLNFLYAKTNFENDKKIKCYINIIVGIIFIFIGVKNFILFLGII